ncbi:rhomboid family intramembrane serine protease [Luteolibacter yonseiensis]|uniref:Rhomboid family intramembrane serine protease n=1 Tax=Luteolibacter yonseiensis TaxID=1144680 RepID=A0A934R6X8_9BACT|nr:rhomboid family intramembrane serine protease [Luteolibacter yonseiensis]MBK1818099.1 rhomboid family intramembrane serine protease [Luteolibacter yonseiensis]
MNSSGAPFANAARNLRQLRSSPASWACVAVVLAIQLVVTAAGGPDQQPAWRWFEWFGLSRGGVLSGRIWQVFSYGLLHGGWIHVVMNSLLILLVGSRVEHMTGQATMMKAVIFGILGGGLGHLTLAPGGQGAPLLVGLSGGCLALLLLTTTLSPQSRMMPLFVSGRVLGFAVLTVELAMALMEPVMGIVGFSHVGHACHFGGGLAGWAYGRWLLRPRVSLKRLRRDRERREAGSIRRLD